MFKKAFTVKSRSLLRSSDRKKLRHQISKNITEEDLEFFFPLKEKEVHALKIKTYNGELGIIYVTDDTPFFMHFDCILPTVFALERYENLIPCLHTSEGAWKHIMDGADLMLPGVWIPEEGIPEFNEGDIIGIRVDDSPPLAVGRALVSAKEFHDSGYKLRGKAVLVLHLVGDALWATGPQKKLENDKENNDQLEGYKDQLDSGEPAYHEPESSNQTPFIPEHIYTVDELLEMTLFTSIKSKFPIDPKLLPMSSSVFYESYVLPSRYPGSMIDMKSSSFKKLGKFLKFYEKKGVLKTKDRNGEIFVTEVNHLHTLILEFELPYEVANSVKSDKKSAPENPIKNGNITIKELFKPADKNIKLFQELNVDRDSMLEFGQIRELVNLYIKEGSLQKADAPRFVNIDPYLCDALLTKEEFNEVKFLPRDEIITRLIPKMQPFYEMKIQDNSKIYKGKPPMITILVERRMGNKVVTRIQNIDKFQIDTESFSEMIKIKCASSTTIDDLPGGHGKEVLVQGHKVKEAYFCLEKFGIPVSGTDKNISSRH